MTNLKAIVFDMDGVLIDARDWHYRALNDALEFFGVHINYEEHLARFNGMPTRQKMEILSEENRIPRYLHKTIDAIKQERTLREAAQLCFPAIDHLLMFSWLAERNIKTGVATNSIRRTSETMLDFAGIYEHLDCLVTNQDVTHAKPSPDIYLEAARRLSVDPSQILVVEDHEIGVRAASEAGCKVIQVSGVQDVNVSLIEQYFGDE